ncbi:MAG: hypothetical protein M1832_001403 [Thelocarpon impressellum]|nr:MAG: hypothetical protein M1832_001403 [Thelocarpon impressellum]
MGQHTILCRHCNFASPRLTPSRRQLDPARTILSTRKYVCDSCTAKQNKRAIVRHYRETLKWLADRWHSLAPGDAEAKDELKDEILKNKSEVLMRQAIWDGFARSAASTTVFSHADLSEQRCQGRETGVAIDTSFREADYFTGLRHADFRMSSQAASGSVISGPVCVTCYRRGPVLSAAPRLTYVCDSCLATYTIEQIDDAYTDRFSALVNQMQIGWRMNEARDMRLMAELDQMVHERKEILATLEGSEEEDAEADQGEGAGDESAQGDNREVGKVESEEGEQVESQEVEVDETWSEADTLID